MCGIAGLLYPKGIATPGLEVVRRSLNDMADTLSHRGPDGEGYWQSPDSRVGLAHKRLSIVDLSEKARQPMTSGNNQVWVTFNGEIYNHKSLRHQLENMGHQFRTDHSDTEVLVHGYEAWGIDGLAMRLEGMFALAIWDMNRKIMTLLRDRVGIKPIYFSRFGGIFRFASEIKALLSDPCMPRHIESTAIGHYLSFMAAPAPLNLFKGIFLKII